MLRLSGTGTSPNRSIHLRWSNEELRDGSQTDTITPQVSHTCFTPYAGDTWNTAVLPAGCVCCSKSTMVLLASHMILISSHTDILHDPHIKQICIPSQHTSAGLTILNVLSSPKQLLLGMHSLKVWSLAPHWMLSRWHWGDRYQASVFEHTNLSCF